MIVTATLISFGTWLTSKLADKGFDYVFNSTTPDTLNEKFYNAVDRAYNKIKDKYPSTYEYSIEYFFKHDNVFGDLIKLLFKNSKINSDIVKSQFDLEILPEPFILEFTECLKVEILADDALRLIYQDSQIFILLQGLSNDVESIAKNSNLNLVQLRELSQFLQKRLTEQFSFEKFYKIYKENALRMLSQVNFIGLGVDISIKRKRKILQDIFVKPLFSPLQRTQSKKKSILDESVEFSLDVDQKSISYNNIFNKDRLGVVILGNPGAGKSVLIKSIICDILNGYAEFENDELGKSIPFRIELRKYLAFKRKNGGNISKFLISSLEEEYGISNVTESIIDQIIQSKLVIVFFDGLDEIFKIRDKIEIKNDIENFCTIYPKIRSLTTSRIIGYDEASLDEKSFVELKIADFNESQIEEYVRKWYDKEEEDTEVRFKEVERFLELKADIDNELIKNPLLLSLIVIIYRNILKIPESKLEIYQSCTKTLVEKWDVEKELQIDLDQRIYKDKEKILSDLAYWQYEQLSSEVFQLSYDKAKNTISKTLRTKLNIGDEIEAEELAESFMNYAQKRSIYFDNTFTHKTFLEYYTAYWIYSNIEKKHKPSERDQLISKYISNPFWFIVLELLFNMIDKDQADSEIIDGIINYQMNNQESYNFILVVLPTLKNIGRSQVKIVLSAAIKYLVDKRGSNKSVFADHLEQIYFRLQHLYDDESFREIIKEEFLNIERDVKYRDDIYTLYLEITGFSHKRSTQDLICEFENSISYESKVNSNIFLYRLHSSLLSVNWHEKYLINLVDLIRKFGVNECFISHPARFGPFAYGPPIDQYFSNQLSGKEIESLGTNLNALESEGLTKKLIIQYLTKNGSIYVDSPQILVVAKAFDKEVDKKNALILLCIIIRFFDRKYYPRQDRVPISNVIDVCSQKKNILIKISQSKTIRDRIKIALKYF